MKIKTINLTSCTIGELREALKDLPDDTCVNVCNTGSTGRVMGLTLDVKTTRKTAEICFNVEAEKL